MTPVARILGEEAEAVEVLVDDDLLPALAEPLAEGAAHVVGVAPRVGGAVGVVDDAREERLGPERVIEGPHPRQDRPDRARRSVGLDHLDVRVVGVQVRRRREHVPALPDAGQLLVGAEGQGEWPQRRALRDVRSAGRGHVAQEQDAPGDLAGGHQPARHLHDAGPLEQRTLMLSYRNHVDTASVEAVTPSQPPSRREGREGQMPPPGLPPPGLPFPLSSWPGHTPCAGA